MIRFTIATAALAAAATSQAQTGTAQPATTAAVAPPVTSAAPAARDRSRRVCRNIVVTGTRLGTRVCRPADDWASDQARTQQRMLDVERNGQRRDGEFNGREQL